MEPPTHTHREERNRTASLVWFKTSYRITSMEVWAVWLVSLENTDNDPPPNASSLSILSIVNLLGRREWTRKETVTTENDQQ